jgi:hypothetical protein
MAAATTSSSSCQLLFVAGAYLQAAARHTATAADAVGSAPHPPSIIQLSPPSCLNLSAVVVRELVADSLSWLVQHMHAVHFLGTLLYCVWRKRVVQAVAEQLLLGHAGRTQYVPGAIGETVSTDAMDFVLQQLRCNIWWLREGWLVDPCCCVQALASRRSMSLLVI